MDLFAVGSGIQENLDAARVRMEATFLGSSFNGTAQILEMQHDNPKRLFFAYLPAKQDSRLPFDVGSKVKLVGVFKAKTEGALDYGQLTTSFEIFLNAITDVTVLQRPPWWTTRHAVWILGGLLAVLTLALAWAAMLRKQVRVRTSELSREIDGHELTERRLQNEIGERKRMQEQVEKTHKELMIASRQAGMAEVATNVLHDVGNTLNSVNISTTIIGDTIRKTENGNLSRAVSLMRDHLPDISAFLHDDPKGKLILDYVDRLAAHSKSQQIRALEEVQNLRNNVEHIKSVVSMQQGYAKVAGVIETFRATEVMEDALKMNEETLENHHLRIVRDYHPAPLVVSTDRHKVLQVLIKLIQNARQACDDSTANGKCITLRIVGGDGMALISVIDDGVGVPPENRERIFNHGFTTRKNGHGFGLHSSFLAAKEMGGDLQFQSAGPGQGATFTLRLPLDKKPIC
jgi:signal transduction histidine kinase